jgi:hypothetical protein
MFHHQVRVPRQQFLIDCPSDGCEQCLPIHRSCTLCLFCLQLALSMQDGRLRVQAGDWRRAGTSPLPQRYVPAFGPHEIRGYTNLLPHRILFRDLSAEDDEQRARERDLANQRKRAAKLGLTLVESPA